MEEKAIVERILHPKKGIFVLVLNFLAIILGFVAWQAGLGFVEEFGFLSVLLAICGGAYFFLIGPILFFGFKIINPNEAIVFTLFGNYYGTLSEEGFYFVNPFVSMFNPAKNSEVSLDLNAIATGITTKNIDTKKKDSARGKRISTKVLTLNNTKQKVNDQMGNPIEIGIVVMWKVISPVKAVFTVDNYMEYLSIQTDSALRNTVRMYPYDIKDSNDNKEISLRASSYEVAQMLKTELQSKVSEAGLEILETKITHLAYAPEIATAMLQRQQASAILDAKKLIVEGAVGMVKMALTELDEQKIVQLDDERKAAMVSNLLVVLCGNKDAQPIVNAGSIY